MPHAVLHSQLQKDCILIGERGDLWLLLHRNATIPWFIIVPKGNAQGGREGEKGYRDLDDLEIDKRTELFALSDRLSGLLRTEFGAEKINVAALGNMVPQLHLHVIGRNKKDPCWPNPVWGNLHQHIDWAQEKLDSLVEMIGAILSD